MEPGEKLKTLRNYFTPKNTQAELAEMIGLGLDVVRNWELGRTALPKAAAMKIAEVYNIDWRWLYDTEDTPPVRENGSRPNAIIDTSEEAARIIAGFTQTVAVRSYIGVLAGLDNEEAYFQEEELPYEIPIAFLIGGHANIDKHAILRAASNSLKPRVRSGSRVLLYDDGILYRNTIVGAEDPDRKVWLKVLREGKDSWELHSLSSTGATFSDLSGWKIKGHAIAIFHEPDEPGPNIEWIRGTALRA